MCFSVLNLNVNINKLINSVQRDQSHSVSLQVISTSKFNLTLSHTDNLSTGPNGQSMSSYKHMVTCHKNMYATSVWIVYNTALM